MFERSRLGLDSHRDEYYKIGRFRVPDLEPCFAHGGRLHIQLFFQLTADRTRVRLAGFALPARKFPQTAMSLVRWSLADKQGVAAADISGDDSSVVGH